MLMTTGSLAMNSLRFALRWQRSRFLILRIVDDSLVFYLDHGRGPRGKSNLETTETRKETLVSAQFNKSRGERFQQPFACAAFNKLYPAQFSAVRFFLVAVSFLIQRFQLNDGGTMVVAHPESDRRRRIIDKHSADIRRPGQQIL